MHRLISVVLPDPDAGFRPVKPANVYPALVGGAGSFRVVT